MDITILGSFIIIIIGYLIGSISSSVIISRKKFNTDVREHFSKNAGATNSSRVMGKKWGLVILLLDSFKPIISVLIAYGLTYIPINNSKFHDMFIKSYIYLAGLAAIIGHCWPIFFKFKGGKGAASSLGLLLIINPIYCLIAIASWWIILFLFKMVSLSSILMVLIAFILSWIPHIPLTNYLNSYNDPFFVINIIIGLTWIIVFIRHFTNLQRMLKKEERKIIFFKKNKK